MNDTQKEKTSFVSKTWSAIKSAFRWVRRTGTTAAKATTKTAVWSAKKASRFVIGVSLSIIQITVSVLATVVLALLCIGVTLGATVVLLVWWLATGMKESYKDFSSETMEAIAVYFQTYTEAMADPEFVKFAEDAYDTMAGQTTKYYVAGLDTPADPDSVYAYGVFTSTDKAWDFHVEMDRRQKFVIHQEATPDLLGDPEDYDRWVFVNEGEPVGYDNLGYREAMDVDFTDMDEDTRVKAYRHYEAQAMDAKDLPAANYWRGRSYARAHPERALSPSGIQLCLAAIYSQTKDEYRKDDAKQGIEAEVSILNRQPVAAGK